MENIEYLFGAYMKDLKLSASEDYIYVVRDNYFGDIVFSVNSTSINMIKCPGVFSERYLNKMISTDAIKKKIIGVEFDIGVLTNNEFITYYECNEKFKRVLRILEQFKSDIILSDIIQQHHMLNDETGNFYNNILTRKAAEGAGRYITNDNIMYMAPCMLPGSKSTDLDAVIYYKTGNDYYVTKFTSHKKTNDVVTLMKFLCL